MDDSHGGSPMTQESCFCILKKQPKTINDDLIPGQPGDSTSKFHDDDFTMISGATTYRDMDYYDLLWIYHR